MSAHKIFCYAPHSIAVKQFLLGLGTIITPDVPHRVHEADELRGLEHITFVTIDGHPQPIPQRMWDVITAQGALVIHVDDQYERANANRLLVHHYPGDARERTTEGAN